ncbi:hypothetical protein LYSIN_03827 [Lysinibacillus sphaericus]|uniref:Uncharacterized protein n=1 Tax=Lysinibacillus sphaericus TaxID=1421 RepID=A0A2S5CUT7_LYSSH|nr:hypothetical protein LYSIN_03827 [Lysinibacillus sphaericus]
METPTIPPSIMWFGTKNSSSPNAIMTAPMATITIRAVIFRTVFFFCCLALATLVVCESLKSIAPIN